MMRRRRMILLVAAVLLLVATCATVAVVAQEEAADPRLGAEAGAATDDADTGAEQEAAGAGAGEGQVPPRMRRAVPPHPLTDMPDRHPGVRTSFFFPEYGAGADAEALPAGERIHILAHVRNEAGVDVNLTAIMGSLQIPFTGQYVMNFTAKPLHQVLDRDAEMTLSYPFDLHEKLQPYEYIVAHTLFYMDTVDPDLPEDQRPEVVGYSDTFYNASVEVYQPNEQQEINAFFLRAGITVFLFVAGYVFVAYDLKEKRNWPAPVVSAFDNLTGNTDKSSRSARRTADNNDDGNDWTRSARERSQGLRRSNRANKGVRKRTSSE